MPFSIITVGKHKGKYKSPSGRVFTKKQVELYYITNGFDKKKLVVYNKRKKGKKKYGKKS